MNSTLKFTPILRLSVLTLLGSVSACVSLVEEPEAFYSPVNLSNEKGLLSLVNGIYNRLGEYEYYGRSNYIMNDMGSDDTDPGTRGRSERVTIDEFTHDANNLSVADVWQNIYNCINRANNTIDIGAGMDLPAVRKAEILGEAYFLRALNYFNAVRYWGDVPLIVVSPKSLDDIDATGSAKRTPVLEVYSQIVKDLMMAEQTLPLQQKEKGRATKGAAQALLAKVFLTQKQWTLAAEFAKKVMDSKQYTLVPDYANLWLVANENGSEHIFSLQAQASSLVNSRYTTAFRPGNYTAGFAINLPMPDLYNSFKEEDYRKQISFLTRFTDPATGKVVLMDAFTPATSKGRPHIGKYNDPGPTANVVANANDTNYPIIRYAEVLLMYAEAVNEAGSPTPEAYAAINLIRARARNNNPAALKTLPDLAALDQAAFRQAVRQERRWELCFEAQRWYDLVRWDVLVPTLSPTRPNVKAFHKLFPIPQAERDRNPNLTQNEGY
ncbi:MAG: RagB/SusD family nutrient uptake outer membrane protein [Cytophagaceae bacterium]|nr:RagB/SusD family nutrient uptake outer membrane protein [Cytophagaceae bacterium]